MTEEEKEAEDRLWEDIEQGIKDNRLSLNTNPLGLNDYRPGYISHQQHFKTAR